MIPNLTFLVVAHNTNRNLYVYLALLNLGYPKESVRRYNFLKDVPKVPETNDPKLLENDILILTPDIDEEVIEEMKEKFEGKVLVTEGEYYEDKEKFISNLKEGIEKLKN